MKDVYKNPVLYYAAVPVLVGLWPLLVWAVYLPAARADIDSKISDNEAAEKIMLDILALDPDRMEFAEPNETAAEFSYGGAVNRVADLCGIPAANWKVRSSIIVETKGQKSQTANVDLRQVDIVRFARFLDVIKLRWANLQCESVKLARKESMPSDDVWDVDIKFKYFF